MNILLRHSLDYQKKKFFSSNLISVRKIVDFQVRNTDLPTIFTIDPIPPETDLNSYKSKMKSNFSLSYDYLSPEDLNYKFPVNGKPEFAFIGRSNVGKSSLISSLLNNDRKLLKISKTPGCTKTLNFFTFYKNSNENSRLDSSQHLFYLIDMPGYGYAQAKKDEIKRWENVLNSYLLQRSFLTLRRVFVLIDSRHGVKNSDVDVFHLLNKHKIPYQIVLTKTDLITEKELYSKLKFTFNTVFAIKNSVCMPYIHTVSSVNNSGIEDLKLNISQIIDFPVHSEPVNEGWLV